MATDFFIKQGDTAPPIVAILKDATSTIVDLTAASSCKFIMKDKATGTKVVDATGSIVDAVNGKVQYAWVTGDTDIADSYNAEFEVHWGNGTFETFPNSKHIQVKIVADLGGSVG